MPLKITFPNPFGFPKPTKDEVQSFQEKYKFSDDYFSFLLNQNGFDDIAFFESDYKNYTTNYSGEEPWQMFGCLHGLNSNSEYYDLIEAQTYNIFEEFFFKIGTDPGGNEFVEVLQGEKKGWIGCIDHDLYIIHETLESFLVFCENEVGYNNLKELSTEKLTEFLISEEFGLINFHAKSMNQFLENCFVIIDDTILIKDLVE